MWVASDAFSSKMVPTEKTIFSTHLSIEEMVDISQCPIELIQKKNFMQSTVEILFTTYDAGKKFYFISSMCVYIYMIIYIKTYTIHVHMCGNHYTYTHTQMNVLEEAAISKQD